MKRFGKVLAIIAGVVALALIVLVVLAKLLITPERVRTTVLPMAERALHRQVAIGKIDISLFSGITVNNLVIKERTGQEPFLAADRVILHYRFWPLLLRRVVIDQIRLDAPKIRITRLADGGFNFSDLTGGTAAARAPTAGGAGRGRKSHFNLLVSNISITRGELLFLDYRISPAAPYRYKLAELSLRARNISPEGSFPFSLQARLNDSTLDLEGKADLGKRSGELKLRVNNLDVTAFTPYFRRLLPGSLGSLKVDLDLSLAGNAQSATSSGSVALKNIDLTLNALKDAPFRGANLTLDYAVKLDLVAQNAKIDKTRVTFNGIPVTLSGQVNHYAKQPAVDLQVETSDLNLRAALAALPKKLVAGVQGMDPAGTLNAQLHLAGVLNAPKKLLQAGEIKLAGVQASVDGLRPALSGTVGINGDTLHAEKLNLSIGDNQAAVDFQVSHLLGHPLTVTSRVSAGRFQLDPLLKGGAAPALAAGARPAAAPAREMGPFDLPLRMDGTVHVGELLYHGVKVDQFVLHYLLKDNVLTVDRLTGNMAGGNFSDTARVQLAQKGLAYETRLAIQGVQADPLVTALQPRAKGTVFGTLDLSAALNGRGTLPATLKKNLSGNGKWRLVDGRLTGNPMVSGLAATLGLPELKDLTFKQLDGNFRVEKGKIILAGHLGGKEVRMSPAGTVGLDGALNLRLDTRLSPTLTGKLGGKGGVTRYLTDSQGWGQVPLKLRGTLTSPRFALDTSLLKGKVRRELEQKLEKKLLKSLGADKNKEQGKQKPAKELLEKTLKGLFGQ